jgi:hypothetical protein
MNSSAAGAAMKTSSADVRTEVSARKPYTKPVLNKGPVLANITAAITVSGIPSDFSDSGPVCWIARAAFGENDLRWLIFRAWLLEDAPHWFRSLYLRHGKGVGAWLAGRARPRQIVRNLMMPAVNRKLRG